MLKIRDADKLFGSLQVLPCFLQVLPHFCSESVGTSCDTLLILYRAGLLESHTQWDNINSDKVNNIDSYEI